MAPRQFPELPVVFNFRVRYTFRPDSDLYVIYTAGSRFQAIAAGNPMQVREQKFAVKITYYWSLIRPPSENRN